MGNDSGFERNHRQVMLNRILDFWKNDQVWV
jgi:hypothetical protein